MHPGPIRPRLSGCCCLEAMFQLPCRDARPLCSTPAFLAMPWKQAGPDSLLLSCPAEQQGPILDFPMQAAARSRAINLMKSLLQLLEPSCQALQGPPTQQAPAVHTLVPVIVEGPDGHRTQAFQLRSTHLPANGAGPASHPGLPLGLAPGQPAACSATGCHVAIPICRPARLGMALTTLHPLWRPICVTHVGCCYNAMQHHPVRHLPVGQRHCQWQLQSPVAVGEANAT